MSKRTVVTSASSPRRSRRSRLVSPLASSTNSCAHTPIVHQSPELFPSTITPKCDILVDRIDASSYSYAQLHWLQLNDPQRYKTRFDFSWCEDSILNSLFPSKFGGRNRIPISHRHTVKSIRQFQELGNKQQLYLLKQEIIRPVPFISEMDHYPCLGLSTSYLTQGITNENRKEIILEGFTHPIRDAIRMRADNMRDELLPDYYMGVHGIIIYNSTVRLLLKEVDEKLQYPILRDNFYFISTVCCQIV